MLPLVEGVMVDYHTKKKKYHLISWGHYSKLPHEEKKYHPISWGHYGKLPPEEKKYHPSCVSQVIFFFFVW